MAVDMFMKIQGIEGESKDSSHKNEIDVLAWSWGMTQSGTGHVGGGSGSGKVNVHDLSFTKYIDKSSPDLMLACCNGKHYGEAKLTVRKAGENPLEYMIVTIECGRLKGAFNGAGIPLLFVKGLTVAALAYPSPFLKMGWDIEANKKL